MELMNHQQTATKICLNQRATLVAYAIGTGKTATALHCLNPRGKNLIVAPASLLANWRKELALWGLDGSIDVEILSYNAIKPEMTADTIIFDEAHLLKNEYSLRTCTAEIMTKRAKRIVMLTATPVLNNIREIKTLYKTMGIELPLLEGKDLHDYLIAKQLMLRVKTKEVLNLPEITFSQKDVKLKDTEEIIRLQEEIRQMYNDAQENMEELWADYQMQLVGKLMQIRRHVGISKTHGAIETINEQLAYKVGEPLVVFGYHQKVLELLAKTFNAPLIYGKTSLKKRNQYVEEFQEGKHPLIVCSIPAAGVGLNLTASSTCMFVEYDWTYASFQQAFGRIYRKGQEQPCNVINLISEHPIDARHMELLEQKQRFVDEIIDGNVNENVKTLQRKIIETILEI